MRTIRSLFVFVLAAIAIIHFFVMPLDLLILNVQTKIQSLTSFLKNIIETAPKS